MKKFICMGGLTACLLLITALPLILNAQVTLDRQGKSPVAMKFQAGSQPTVGSFFQEYRQAYPLSDENELRALKTSQDVKGSHHRYDQYYKGVQVIGAQFILHETGGKVWCANGHLVHGLNLGITPVLSEGQALKLALEEINAQAYMWEKPGNEALLKKVLNDQNATYYPSGELKLTSGYEFPSSENVKLVWRFDIYAQQPLGRYWVDVDANTGEIVYKESRIHNGDVPGSGESLFYGNVNMTVDELVPGSMYRLHEYTTRLATIQTYNLQNYWDYDHVVDFESASAIGPWDPVGVTVHHGIESTYDYFLAEHGRNSYDDAGGPLYSFAHYGVNYDNAFWDGYVMTFGDGDGFWDGPLVSYDVIAHELTHGVTQYSSNLIYYCESGALNESFSDIFGNLVEFNMKGEPGVGTGSWRIGEDFSLQGQGGFRNMADPNEFQCPDTYLGDYWFPSNGGDNGGVHMNSGVMNFWFYLLATGGSGVNDNGDPYDVPGIGLTDAGAIAYLSNNAFLFPISNFSDARLGSLFAAEYLFGAGSSQAIAVAEAWDAVGVYDFPAPANDLCEAAIEIFCNDVINGTTIGATYDPGAPGCDYDHSAPGVWYKFVGNGHTMHASMCDGPVWDARLTIYEGNCDELVCVTADDDGCGGYSTVSQVVWFASEDIEYYLLVHGYLGCIGDFQLALTSLDPPEIAVTPEELNFIVPFMDYTSYQFTIYSNGEDCLYPLTWKVLNLEPDLPASYAGISRQQENDIPVLTSFDGVKPGIAPAEGFGFNPQATEETYKIGTPAQPAGNANLNGTEGDRAITSEFVTVTITHSLDQGIVSGNSAACFYGDVLSDNSYWRAFKLTDFDIINDFTVSNVEIAVEWAQEVNSTQQITVNLFKSEGAPFPNGILSPIGTATYDLPNQAFTMMNLPVNGLAPEDTELVVEIFCPGGNFFFIGSNSLGQTGPSYVSAPWCGIYTPTDFALLGFPGMHMVMNVTGTYEKECPWLSVSPFNGNTLPGNSDEVTINVDAAGLMPGIYECSLDVKSNASNSGHIYIPVTMTVVDITPPVITVADPITLWPPNHKYTNLDLAELLVSIVDDVDGNIPVQAADITFSTSDEMDDAPGIGDGKTINDMVIAPDCKSVDLRNERDDSSDGRVYWVNVSVSDDAGNIAEALCEVLVPHDMASEAIDSGADHFVYSTCFTMPADRIATGTDDNVIGSYELSVYPNPFSGTTTIQFSLKEPGMTTLAVYNLVGQKVATLFNSDAEAGHQYTVTFNGSNLPEGVYFYRLQGGPGVIATDKIIQIK